MDSPAILPNIGTARNNSIENDNHFIRESTDTHLLMSVYEGKGGVCLFRGKCFRDIIDLRGCCRNVLDAVDWQIYRVFGS